MQSTGSQLRFAAYNVENLFIFIDKPLPGPLEALHEIEWQRASSSTVENKPIAQLRALAKVIEDINADIYMLSEVGGMESLDNFCRMFLKNGYRPLLIEGNSDRGIDLGYLVRADLPYEFKLRSHKERILDFQYPHERQSIAAGEVVKPHRFSRDILELRVFTPHKGLPDFVLLVAHLKSQLDRDGIDPMGKDRRHAELLELLKIYSELETELGPDMPVLIGGDFNGVAAATETDPEFIEIYKNTDLKDALELAGRPKEERFTHIQILPYGPIWYKQFDYIFVSSAWQKQVVAEQSYVYRYKDEFGMKIPAPRTLPDKRRLPSDHYPIVVTLHINN